MYANLDRELSANKVSWRAAAEAIAMPEATFRNKITDGRFTIEEAFKIKRRLLPKFELEYLFESSDASVPALAPADLPG
jgi:hypothetical protein